MIELTQGRRRRLRRTAYVAAPAVLASLAILHPGAAVSQVDLNDGAVWLTNASAVRLGRYNPVVDELNAGLIAQASTFDVLQDGMDVLLVEPNRVAVVDPASVALGSMADIPYGAAVSMAGGTTSVTRPTDGAVFAAPTQGIGALQVASGEPDLTLGAGGAAVVARSGVVLGVESDGTVHRLDVGADGSQDSAAGHLHGTPAGDVEQITAVGDEVVVLAAGRLLTTQGDVDLTGYGGALALQQPGPRADSVLVATTTALLEVPMGGGTPREIVSGGNGAPSAPVRVAGCAYAAWASPVNGYLVSCPGSDPQVVNLQGIASSDTLVFRVNRGVVVLNDAISGRVWLPMEDPEAREPNWEDIEEAPTDAEEDQAQDPEVAPQDLQAECATQPAPPTAEDDEYGARAGSTTVLPVIANDASSNCGILVVSEFTALDEQLGTLELVDGGRAFQLRTDATATGVAEFTYTVTDGRGDTAPDTATVRVSIAPDAANQAPVQQRTGAMLTELGGAATYDVLSDFTDPDGDQLVLIGAVAPGGGTARARGDGRVRFQSDNATLGRQTIQLTVSDGVESFVGEMYVDVRPTGNVPPVIDAVHVIAHVDEVVTVRPLDAVRTESRVAARLAGVEEVRDLTVTADTAGGTFTVMSRTPGTYYVPFTVTAAPQQATGLARVDVLERPQEASVPVPVLDLALLPPGGEVTIDPLANDTDATGAVLVLQSVDVPSDSGLRVAILDHHLLRFTATRTLDGPVEVGYRVSNGAAAAVGTVRVHPVPAAADQLAPVVPDVEVTVRTGGVVTIPVLEDAFDPDGDELTLVRELPDAPAGAQGLMFVSGDVLRYRAPDVPTEVAVTFTVTDPMGNQSSGVVTVKVHEADSETKAPAQPEPLTARVYAGESVEIPVPLTGIDADGDGVLLLGPDQTPTKGIVTVGAADQLVYEAFPGESGTDTFTYAVEDWTGRRAVATVQVGVTQRPSAAAEVISRDDAVAVRPGQTVDVMVLANDVDTGGGDLTLDELLAMDAGVDASVDGSRITVHTTDPGLLQIMYTARNDRGGQDKAMLTVTVDEDAPILAPIAHDVVVPASDTVNATRIEVDVLAVAQNPSGPMDDLVAEVDASAADVAAVTTRGTIDVLLVDHTQTLPFLVRNTDPEAEGISTYAFIVVPALGDFPPLLRPGAADLAVLSGEPLELDLDDLVQVAPGRHAIVDDWSTVQTAHADGSTPVVDDGTLRFTSEEGYAGPASISALVSDGPLDDPTTHSRTLTFPITVLGAEQDPPTFTPSVLDVAPGDTSRVDLAVFTSAPVETASGPGQYEFSLTGKPAGFTVDLDGSVLSVTPGDQVPRGTVAGIQLAIDYGGDEPVVAQVDVRVVASSRGLARLLTFEVPDGVEGQPSTVAVLEGAFNPFPETPLTLLEAVVETPDTGDASVSGDRVTVQPNAGFIGQMVTRFSARDATGDLDRVVEGRIVLTVRGAPDAPTTPRVTDPGDGVLRVSWEAPVNNGEPIDAYRVTAVEGGVVRECVATSCVIDGLTNDVTYRFTVAAHNAVGWSEESTVSGDGRPDVLPERPDAPTVTRHDGWLHVEWAAPINRGSPITGYDVRITPASPEGSVLSTRGAVTSMDLRGLANGTDYRVSICAKNNSGAAEWQCSGETVGRPARRPDIPTNVGANWGWFGGDLTVTWQEPWNNGGEPITGYVIRGTGGPDVTLGADARQFTFPAQIGQMYTVTVAAVNVEGESDRVSTSGHVFAAPGPVTGLTATVDGGATGWDNGRVVLAWQAPQDTGGVRLDHYLVTDGSRQFTANGTSFTMTGLRGRGWTFTVTPVNVDEAAGPATSVDAAVVTVPQQLLGPPLADVGTAGVVTFDWSSVVGADGGSAITGYRYRLEAQGEGQVDTTQPGTSLQVPVAYEGQWMRLTVWVVNAAGESASREVQAVGHAAVAPVAPAMTVSTTTARSFSDARRAQ